MRRLFGSLLVLVGSAATLSPAGAAPAGTADACEEPTVERTYDSGGFALRLGVDLSGCDWWEGGPIQLAAELFRLGGTGEEGVGSFTVCGVHPITQEPGGEADDGWREAATCEVSVALEHPPVEVARYHGEVSYPWEDGDRTVGFDTTCVSPVVTTCRDDR